MRELNLEPIRSVERAISILGCFSFEHPTLSIEHIMKKTKLAKATVYRLLWTMEKNQLIQYDSKSNEYRLGNKLLELGGIVLENFDIKREAEPYLVKLHEQTGHSVILAIPQGETVQYLMRFDSNEGLQPNNFVGRKRILHNGALGIVLLAFMEREFVEKLLEDYPLVSLTPKTLTNQEDFLVRLNDIKAKGFYVDEDETFIGYTAIAVPVFLDQQKSLAAIGVSGASYKMDGERRKHLIELLRETAKNISKQFGYMYS